jgi:hypothetical protein
MVNLNLFLQQCKSISVYINYKFLNTELYYFIDELLWEWKIRNVLLIVCSSAFNFNCDSGLTPY